ncbi:hypothetical protein Taro_023426, partial [Colocasia esculenta]|nr:hypothetical protein [Colocasia esculenta]
AEEEQKKKREEKEQKWKEVEEQKRKEVEEEQKRKDAEKKKIEEEEQRKKEAEKKRKEAEDAEKERKEEEEEKRKTEEEEKKRKRRHISPSSLSRRPEDYRYYKAAKVNVSISEPIFLSSQESTDTLSTGKKERRRDYVAREVLGVDEKFWIERFLNECIINEYVL